MAAPGNLAVLGSTGTIGKQTLDIVRRNPAQFAVIALVGNSNAALLAEQAREFRPRVVVTASETTAEALRKEIGALCEVELGAAAICAAAAMSEVHTVVAGIVGFACLPPVLAAIKSGKHIALANKECLVAGGDLVRQALDRSSSVIVPVDSEHNSVLQCLDASGRDCPRSITLTASGGPFWQYGESELLEVTPEMAVKHPRWNMGAKISVDSATLMNKGFEVIEAAWLFNLPGEKIKVLIHPQSIVHGFAEFDDGAVIACLYEPDMRVPLSHALGRLCADDPRSGFGRRLAANGASPLALARHGRLEFFEASRERFRSLALAYDSLRQGGAAGAVLNAANEQAVAAFLDRRIRFVDITRVVEDTLESCAPAADIWEADKAARETVEFIIRAL